MDEAIFEEVDASGLSESDVSRWGSGFVCDADASERWEPERWDPERWDRNEFIRAHRGWFEKVENALERVEVCTVVSRARHRLPSHL